MRPFVQELFRAIRYILMTKRHPRHDIGHKRAKKRNGRIFADAAKTNSP
jgi:hypothetical protein